MKQNKLTERIVSGSMGSFLLPPLHPGLTNEVELDTNRKKENRGGMSLEYAASKESYCHPTIKQRATDMILDWKENKRLPLASPEVQKWLEAVKAHMGGKAKDYIIKYYPEYSGITI